MMIERRRRRREAECKAEAAWWVARLHSDSCTDLDQVAWRNWISGDPLRQEAFARATDAWELAGTVPDEPFVESARLNRRTVLACLATTVSFVVGGWALMWNRPTRYETGLGEQRRIALGEGSSVLLDTSTVLGASLSLHQRNIVLNSGRAQFNVAQDPERPFVVQTAAARVIAIGTCYDVATDKNGTDVLLTSGSVAVIPASSGSNQHLILSPGELMRVNLEGHISVKNVDLAIATAWTSGRLIFDAEPLAQAVTEMSRYSKTPIRLSSLKLGEVRISGSYQTNDPMAFAKSIALLVGCEVQVSSDEILLIGSAPFNES